MFSLVGFFVMLIVEIALAMTLYIWIKGALPSVFVALQGVGSSVLSLAASLLGDLAPSAADNASLQLFGELSNNAMVLLILGLLASGVVRVLLWTVRGVIGR